MHEVKAAIDIMERRPAASEAVKRQIQAKIMGQQSSNSKRTSPRIICWREISRSHFALGKATCASVDPSSSQEASFESLIMERLTFETSSQHYFLKPARI